MAHPVIPITDEIVELAAITAYLELMGRNKREEWLLPCNVDPETGKPVDQSTKDYCATELAEWQDSREMHLEEWAKGKTSTHLSADSYRACARAALEAINEAAAAN